MSTAKRDSVRFHALDDAESRALLASQHVGRLAFTLHDRVDIEPISYVLVGDWLYGRTSEGTKLSVLKHSPWVAFEVDDIRTPFDWRSVVVHGTAYFLSGEPPEDPLYREALELLRSADARILTDADPAKQRTHLFRIYLNSLTGRA